MCQLPPGCQTLYCAEAGRIRECFQNLTPFQAVVEATASYEWLFQLLEPLADRVLLAHPKKLRIIAEALLDGKVMLRLWVKVKSGWSDDERALKSLGYDDI